MNDFGKKLLKFVALALLAKGAVVVGEKAIDNLSDGKDVFGREKKEPAKTKVDWKGRIKLGTDDYSVV